MKLAKSNNWLPEKPEQKQNTKQRHKTQSTVFGEHLVLENNITIQTRLMKERIGIPLSLHTPTYTELRRVKVFCFVFFSEVWFLGDYWRTHLCGTSHSLKMAVKWSVTLLYYRMSEPCSSDAENSGSGWMWQVVKAAADMTRWQPPLS